MADVFLNPNFRPIITMFSDRTSRSPLGKVDLIIDSTAVPAPGVGNRIVLVTQNGSLPGEYTWVFAGGSVRFNMATEGFFANIAGKGALLEILAGLPGSPTQYQDNIPMPATFGNQEDNEIWTVFTAGPNKQTYLPRVSANNVAATVRVAAAADGTTAGSMEARLSFWFWPRLKAESVHAQEAVLTR